MIHPSYTELIQAINTNSEDDDTTCLLYTSIAKTVEIGVQVNGKVRGTIVIPNGCEKEKAFEIAKADERIASVSYTHLHIAAYCYSKCFPILIISKKSVVFMVFSDGLGN